MLSRGTVCVLDVTHLTGNWVTVFVREKLPSLRTPPPHPLQPTHSEKDKPLPGCGRCQRCNNQSVGSGVTIATVPCCDSAGSTWGIGAEKGSSLQHSSFSRDAE